MKPLLLCLLLLIITACTAPTQQHIHASLSAVEALNPDNITGFSRVTTPRPFTFAKDHGPHPDYQIEWWYYTGNLQTDQGHHLGYQLTFFRNGISAHPPTRQSQWNTHNIYMAHLAVTDVQGKTFYAFERFSRDGANLAGASSAPYRVFLEDWFAQGNGPEGMHMHIQATQEPIALDLDLISTKPPTLQGDQGLSQKGSAVGNASYYYSLTRLETTGTIRIDKDIHTVYGLSWMDHEWSTSALEEHAAGWDWFSIQLDNGYDLTYWRIRLLNPETTDVSHHHSLADATLAMPDGTTQRILPDAIEVQVYDTWHSPSSQATYPARWNLNLPDQALHLEITPYLPNQELPTSIVYWEGAVHVNGTHAKDAIQGHGYVELTGYTSQ